MKKIIFASIAIVFLLGACNSKKNDQVEATQSETSTSEVTKSTGSAKPIKLTKNDFLAKVWNYEQKSDEFTYSGDKPCIVDFYADWCGPCKMIAPYLDELASEYSDQIYIYKIDVDAEEELAAAFGIQSIPTLLFVPQSGKPEVITGGLSKKELKSKIESILLKK